MDYIDEEDDPNFEGPPKRLSRGWNPDDAGNSDFEGPPSPFPEKGPFDAWAFFEEEEKDFSPPTGGSGGLPFIGPLKSKSLQEEDKVAFPEGDLSADPSPREKQRHNPENFGYLDSWLARDLGKWERDLEPRPLDAPRRGFLSKGTWPALGDVTSKYQPSRLHPVDNVYKPHHAIDIANPLGEKVVASRRGRVESIDKSPGGENQVIVRNDDGTRSGYAHVTPSVEKGQWVREGETIGVTDLSGNTRGAHLHYSFSNTWDRKDHADPLKHLPER